VVLYWCVWQESVTLKMFYHLILYKEIYKFCTFSAICEDNAEINCVTVRHRKRFISFDFYASKS
jgi:hypothetical protein